MNSYVNEECLRALTSMITALAVRGENEFGVAGCGYETPRLDPFTDRWCHANGMGN